MARIDHLMWAASDLDRGMDWAASTFGVAPAHGGSHVGLGTRNALLSLGDVYLEIIAPDPEQDLTDTLGERIAALKQDGLATWCASADLAQQSAAFAARGIRCRGPQRTERRTTASDLLIWELLFPTTGTYGGCMPFFIDWLDCAHPASTNPLAGRFTELEITHADAAGLSAALGETVQDVQIRGGTAATLIARVTLGEGSATLTSTGETLGLF
ncbi:MAG: VOC family protein [Pseudomonadota bacterium]